DAIVLLLTVIVTTVVWLTATMMTKPEPQGVLESFYKRVRPGGIGWRRISTPLGFGAEQIPGGRIAWLNWLAGVVAVYATLFGIGKIVFGEWGLCPAARHRGRGLRVDRPCLAAGGHRGGRHS